MKDEYFSSTKLRIKINVKLTEFLKSYISKTSLKLTNESYLKFWFYLDMTQIKCIKELRDHLVSIIFKRNYSSNLSSLFQLEMDECELPLFETTRTLRDSDCISLVSIERKKRKFSTSEEAPYNKKSKVEFKEITKKKSYEVCFIGSSMIRHVDINQIFPSTPSDKIYFESISGGQIKGVFAKLRKLESSLENCKLFLMTIGSNDCDSLNEINVVVNDILELSKYLRKTYPKSKIVFNQLIPRLSTRYTKLEDFEVRRQLFNSFIETTLSLLDSCQLIKHEQFEAKNDLENLLADGVHLSSSKGLVTYIDNIKIFFNGPNLT